MSDDEITIPALCIEALGGLQPEDPALILWRKPDFGLAPHHSTHHPFDPVELNERDRIVVRPSAPALIAVLHRLRPFAVISYPQPGADWRWLANSVVREAITAHGSDPGWKIEP